MASLASKLFNMPDQQQQQNTSSQQLSSASSSQQGSQLSVDHLSQPSNVSPWSNATANLFDLWPSNSLAGDNHLPLNVDNLLAQIVNNCSNDNTSTAAAGALPSTACPLSAVISELASTVNAIPETASDTLLVGLGVDVPEASLPAEQTLSWSPSSTSSSTTAMSLSVSPQPQDYNSDHTNDNNDEGPVISDNLQLPSTIGFLTEPNFQVNQILSDDFSKCWSFDGANAKEYPEPSPLAGHNNTSSWPVTATTAAAAGVTMPDDLAFISKEPGTGIDEAFFKSPHTIPAPTQAAVPKSNGSWKRSISGVQDENAYNDNNYCHKVYEITFPTTLQASNPFQFFTNNDLQISNTNNNMSQICGTIPSKATNITPFLVENTTTTPIGRIYTANQNQVNNILAENINAVNTLHNHHQPTIAAAVANFVHPHSLCSMSCSSASTSNPTTNITTHAAGNIVTTKSTTGIHFETPEMRKMREEHKLELIRQQQQQQQQQHIQQQQWFLQRQHQIQLQLQFQQLQQQQHQQQPQQENLPERPSTPKPLKRAHTESTLDSIYDFAFNTTPHQTHSQAVPVQYQPKFTPILQRQFVRQTHQHRQHTVVKKRMMRRPAPPSMASTTANTAMDATGATATAAMGTGMVRAVMDQDDDHPLGYPIMPLHLG